MKWDSHLQSAATIINQFEGQIPLAAFLRDFFRHNPRMGSADRKSIAAMVYAFYRLGHALGKADPAQRILAGLLLCSKDPVPALEYMVPEWASHAGDTLSEKMELVARRTGPITLEELFPWKDQLSRGVEPSAFFRSLLRQPRMFLRIRDGMHDQVLGALAEAGVALERLGADGVALPAATKTGQILTDPSWYQIQDDSSQRTARFFNPDLVPLGRGALVWDCCAGSGGKSILFHDLHPEADLWVSDSRPAMIRNLRSRFRDAGITRYHSSVVDISGGALPPFHPRQAAVLIADVPCTGSGTWARTPEQLYFFHPGRILKMKQRQIEICNRILPCLKTGGSLVYITCSVFAGENEGVVEEICSQHGLELRAQEILEGYAQGADTLFAALLTKVDKPGYQGLGTQGHPDKE